MPGDATVAAPISISVRRRCWWMPAGGALLIAGQKSGVVYALDPDRKGEIVWQLRVGKGSTNGGVLWGMAADGQNAYAAVSDVARQRRKPTDAADLRQNDLDPEKGGGLTAIRLSDGNKTWYAPGHPCDPAEGWLQSRRSQPR